MIRIHDKKILRKDIIEQLWRKDGRHLTKQSPLIGELAGCRSRTDADRTNTAYSLASLHLVTSQNSTEWRHQSPCST